MKPHRGLWRLSAADKSLRQTSGEHIAAVRHLALPPAENLTARRGGRRYDWAYSRGGGGEQARSLVTPLLTPLLTPSVADLSNASVAILSTPGS